MVCVGRLRTQAEQSLEATATPSGELSVIDINEPIDPDKRGPIKPNSPTGSTPPRISYFPISRARGMRRAKAKPAFRRRRAYIDVFPRQSWAAK